MTLLYLMDDAHISVRKTYGLVCSPRSICAMYGAVKMGNVKMLTFVVLCYGTG